jgi:TRAP-type C4-dicarboxylate transport system permease large subunit
MPPMGVGLLMALRFANLSVGQHFRTYVPYMLALFAGLLLIICIPRSAEPRGIDQIARDD